MSKEYKVIRDNWVSKFLNEYIGAQPTSFTGPADDEVGEKNLTLPQWYEQMLNNGMDHKTIKAAVLSTYPDLGEDDVEMMKKQALPKKKKVPLEEAEPYQDAVKAAHPAKKKDLIRRGKQSNDVAGSPYKKKPTYKRGKSAPPGFGGSLEEGESRNGKK